MPRELALTVMTTCVDFFIYRAFHWLTISVEQAGPSHFPPDVRVKRGHSWSEQLGIAIACLCEKGERQLVEWTKGVGQSSTYILIIADHFQVVEADHRLKTNDH